MSADLPNKKLPELYRMVTKHMMHDSWGVLNQECPCTKNDMSCKNYYTWTFCDSTSQGKDSYLVYMQGHMLDNRWVVPYNSYSMGALYALYNIYVVAESMYQLRVVWNNLVDCLKCNLKSFPYYHHHISCTMGIILELRCWIVKWSRVRFLHDVRSFVHGMMGILD
jgi:hypothetical protein